MGCALTHQSPCDRAGEATGLRISSTMPTENPDSIVAYIPMRPVGGSSLRVAAIFAAIGLGMILIGVLLNEELAILGVMICAIAVPITAILFVRYASRLAPVERRLLPYRGLERQPHEGGRLIGGGSYRASDHLASVLFETKLPILGDVFFYSMETPDHWRRLCRLQEFHGVAMPRAIVDERLQPELVKLPLTHDLLEPEAVVSGKAVGGKFHMAFGVLYLLFALTIIFTFGTGKFLGGWFYLFFALSCFASTPTIRRLLRNHRWEHNAPIAGCGVIKFPNEKRWTCNDAVMIVQPASLLGGISVSILG